METHTSSDHVHLSSPSHIQSIKMQDQKPYRAPYVFDKICYPQSKSPDFNQTFDSNLREEPLTPCDVHSMLLAGQNKKKDKSQVMSFKSPVAHLRNSLDTNVMK